MIYHYCSAQSFMKIIESGFMKLNDVATMNDRMEGEWGRFLIQRMMKNYDTNEQAHHIALKVKSIINKCLADQFICCFSEEWDLLSQWRAYANDGQGYAIGFNEDDISISQNLPMESDNIKECLGLYPVIYSKDEQETIVNTYLHNIFFNNDIDGQCERLSQYITVFKNPAFEEEKEWRIIYTPTIIMKNISKEFNFNIKNAISNCEFNLTKFGISPYFKWNFKGEKSFPIKEIVIGPQNLTNPDNLAFFLYTHGIDWIKISVSRATYRS